MICKKKVFIIAIVLIIVLSSSICMADKVKIEDYRGVEVTVDTPVNNIVCLCTSAAQILMALDSFDKVIAWDENSEEDIFPQPDRELKIVAKNPHSIQIEAIAELNPDLVIADTQFHDEQRKKLKVFGIPVIIERTSDPERVLTTITNIAKIVGKEKRAEELISFIFKYKKLIKDRIKDIDEDGKTSVYWEWYKPYKTGSKGSVVHPKIVQAGGINICADVKGKYPTISSEYIWESNPEVIVKQGSRGASKMEMQETYNSIINRASLSSTAAVQKANVYVITWDIFCGLPSIIGDLYFAKWIQPNLFKDINPEQVYEKLLKDFFAVEEFTTRVYFVK